MAAAALSGAVIEHTGLDAHLLAGFCTSVVRPPLPLCRGANVGVIMKEATIMSSERDDGQGCFP